MTEDLGGYVLLEQVAAGAHGVIHRGHPVDHPARLVAVKRLAGPARADGVARLQREAEALERLAHPSIVGILDVVADGAGIALILPYLSGGSLADRLATHGALTPSAVADLGARVGSALAAAHGADVLHRDLKPANVLYDAEGQPLVTDFGVALLRDTAPEDGIEIPGTAEYLDPALLSGQPPGPRSDIYALGVICFEALAGQPPYAASTPEATVRAAQRGMHLPLERLAPDTPVALRNTIERAMAPDPEDRFFAAHELAGQCEEARLALERDRGIVLPPPPPVPDVEPAAAPPATRSEPEAQPGGGVERSHTRLFGPRPPAVDEPDEPTRLRPWLIVAAAAVVLVPLLTVWLLVGREAEPQTAPEPDLTPSTPDATSTPPTSTPTPCADAPMPPDDAGEVHLADLDGRGCGLYVAWNGTVLTVPGEQDDPVRYRLGEPGDQLLLGDWDCDGHDTPGLYRPQTGEVFTFGGFAAADGALESSPARDTGVVDGTPSIEPGDDGCERISVAPPG